MGTLRGSPCPPGFLLDRLLDPYLLDCRLLERRLLDRCLLGPCLLDRRLVPGGSLDCRLLDRCLLDACLLDGWLVPGGSLDGPLRGRRLGAGALTSVVMAGARLVWPCPSPILTVQWLPRRLHEPDGT